MKHALPRIGALALENPLILAPMAGITHQPFRLLCRRLGAGLVCSEMVSANGLAHAIGRSTRLMAVVPAERPVSIQIFGSDPKGMAMAAAAAQASGADVVDINFGCSVKKVLKGGAGAALMGDPVRAEAVIRAVRGAVSCPVSVKMRTGWDASGQDALELARIAEGWGVDLLAVHPRTAKQGFSGTADWNIIRAVKRAVSIPVAGNGDVILPGDALAMMERTGCDFVMIGRAARRAPWLFSQTLDVLAGREPVEPLLADRKAIMLECLDALGSFFGEAAASLMMKSHLPVLSWGLPESRPFREAFVRVRSLEEARESVEEFFRFLKAREASGEPPA
ncbi:MAG: tRNA dihydrouridine synthase DusB [Pseudomonadota bacterium]